jgi:hypothetical protein
MAWIEVKCLNCGHAALIGESDLSRHELPRDVPLVTLTKRLTCSRCGSHAVKAFRRAEIAPSIAPS